MFAKNKFELIAYRGGAGERPENTMAAFKHAVETFPDVILDVDLQPTRDGKVIVFHDSTLERTTNGTGSIRQHDLRDLQELDASYGLKNGNGEPAFRNHPDAKIIELSTLLDQFANRVLLDIRWHDRGFIDQVIQTVEQANARQRCVIMSESQKTIRYVRKKYRSFDTAAAAKEVRWLLLGTKLRMSGLISSESEYFMIPEVHNDMQVLSDRFWDELRRREKRVYIWTVDNLADVSRLRSMGIHGIFTNYPGELCSQSTA